MVQYFPVVTGSLTVNGNLSVSGNVAVTGSLSGTSSLAANAELLSGTGSVGFTTTGSFTVASSSLSSRTTQIEAVYATTGSNSFRATQSITGSLTVTGQIIAQTINVQQVTSSIVYSSGSNVFGCDINSRQTFTGSFYQTGSVAVFNSCVGVNTTTPQSLLDIQNCVNSAYNNTNTLTTGQWLRLSNLSTCNGITSGILFQATGPNGGNGIATINGVTVACGSMTLTFGTRNSSGDVTEKMRILSTGGVAMGTQTQTPCVHSGANTGGLIVQGLNGSRGIIEIWDGTTSGKGVFQQVNGTTYLGNLDLGTGTGELQLLVNGQGSSATTAMTLTKCGHIVVNNAPNAQVDYGRMTISTCMSKFMNCSSQEHTALHLSTCESDTPFGMKIAIFGGSCSCTRYASIQTGDHYISNQGNIVFQVSGGHVGIGCTTPNTPLYVVGEITSQNGEMYFKRSTFNEYGHIYMGSDKNFYIRQTAACNISLYTNGLERLRIVGNGEIRALTTIQNWVTAGGDNYTLDTMNAYQSIANGAYVDFSGMSGMILVNNWSNGAMTAFLVGGGNTTVMGTITGTAGTMHHSPGVGGYRWCNNYGSTANFGFQVFRTRNTA